MVHPFGSSAVLDKFYLHFQSLYDIFHLIGCTLPTKQVGGAALGISYIYAELILWNWPCLVVSSIYKVSSLVIIDGDVRPG